MSTTEYEKRKQSNLKDLEAKLRDVLRGVGADENFTAVACSRSAVQKSTSGGRGRGRRGRAPGVVVPLRRSARAHAQRPTNVVNTASADTEASEAVQVCSHLLLISSPLFSRVCMDPTCDVNWGCSSLLRRLGFRSAGVGIFFVVNAREGACIFRGSAWLHVATSTF
jgi:hypothetical protein